MTGSFLLLAAVSVNTILYDTDPHHYIFFNLDRHRISEKSFLDARDIEGAQLKYTWRELEPQKGVYEFGEIENALSFLSENNKRLFIQLQDVTFDTLRINVPDYLLQDPQYHGGAEIQFDADDQGKNIPEGWVSRRWDPEVQERFFALLRRLGKRFDGRIEGINLPETSIGFGEDPGGFPQGFTTDGYRDAIITTMRVLKKAFPTSITMQYSNFMPGEWLPYDDKGYLRSIFEAAVALDVGLGCPDLLPWKPGQMNNPYTFIRQCRDRIPTGVAVQWGNFQHINPKTSRPVTMDELLSFANDHLGVSYLFWGTQEPFYSDTVLPRFD